MYFLDQEYMDFTCYIRKYIFPVYKMLLTQVKLTLKTYFFDFLFLRDLNISNISNIYNHFITDVPSTYLVFLFFIFTFFNFFKNNFEFTQTFIFVFYNYKFYFSEFTLCLILENVEYESSYRYIMNCFT